MFIPRLFIHFYCYDKWYKDFIKYTLDIFYTLDYLYKYAVDFVIISHPATLPTHSLNNFLIILFCFP